MRPTRIHPQVLNHLGLDDDTHRLSSVAVRQAHIRPGSLADGDVVIHRDPEIQHSCSRGAAVLDRGVVTRLETGHIADGDRSSGTRITFITLGDPEIKLCCRCGTCVGNSRVLTSVQRRDGPYLDRSRRSGIALLAFRNPDLKDIALDRGGGR